MLVLVGATWCRSWRRWTGCGEEVFVERKNRTISMMQNLINDQNVNSSDGKDAVMHCGSGIGMNFAKHASRRSMRK